MLSREEFDLVVAEKIGDFLSQEEGKRVRVTQTESLKNNDTRYRGIRIYPPDGNVGVTIYLNVFYLKYLCGAEYEEIMEQIADIYERNKPDQKHWLESMDFTYEAIKDKVIFKVVSMKNNQQTLRQFPYHELGNGLAMTYAVLVDIGDNGIATAAITRERAKLYGYDMEQLRKDALENTSREMPPIVSNIHSLVSQMTDSRGEGGNYETVRLEEAANDPKLVTDHPLFGSLIPDDNRMLVLTNASFQWGAAALYYPGVQEQLATIMGGGYYVLPPSIHELIILSDRSELSPEELEVIVKEINETQVEPVEVLSDKVLRYDPVNKELYRPLDRVKDKSVKDQETEREER